MSQPWDIIQACACVSVQASSWECKDYWQASWWIFRANYSNPWIVCGSGSWALLTRPCCQGLVTAASAIHCLRWPWVKESTLPQQINNQNKLSWIRCGTAVDRKSEEGLSSSSSFKIYYDQSFMTLRLKLKCHWFLFFLFCFFKSLKPEHRWMSDTQSFVCLNVLSLHRKTVADTFCNICSVWAYTILSVFEHLLVIYCMRFLSETQY